MRIKPGAGREGEHDRNERMHRVCICISEEAEGSTKVVSRKSENRVVGNEREGEDADISVIWKRGWRFWKWDWISRKMKQNSGSERKGKESVIISKTAE